MSARLRRRGPATLAALVAAALVAAGCGDGRTLRPPSGDQTTTTAAAIAPAGDASVITAPAVPPDGGVTPSAPELVLSAPFVSGSPLPVDYTCDGPGGPPPLAWGEPPAGTAELALLVLDLDADQFVHWAVSGIEPRAGVIGGSAVAPPGAVEALNTLGTPGWTPACPPPGETPHTYTFTLYALAAPLGLAPGTPAQQAAAAIDGAGSLAITSLATTAAR